MVAWMAYTALVASGLGLAAWLAERGLRRLGRPVRWVWLAAMAGTVGLPVGLLIAGVAGAGVPTGSVGPVASRALMEPMPWSGLGSGPGVLDGVLLGAWVVVSLVLLANLRLAVWTVRRNERSWRAVRVEGRRALVSKNFGPGVIGVRRPRIVLPAWLLEAESSLRRLVVLHEEEHTRSGDPRLLLAGLVLSAAVPWCFPVWWQLHRLRAAIEADCDVRVLARSAPARDYARALVAVAGRESRRLPVPMLAPRPAELERRIRRITGVQGRPGRGAVGLLVAAAVVAVVLVRIPPPEPPGLRLPTVDVVDTRPAVRVFLSVEGPGSR